MYGLELVLENSRLQYLEYNKTYIKNLRTRKCNSEKKQRLEHLHYIHLHVAQLHKLKTSSYREN